MHIFKNLFNAHHRKIVWAFCLLFILCMSDGFGKQTGPLQPQVPLGQDYSDADKSEPIVTDSSSFNFSGSLKNINRKVNESFTLMNKAALLISTNSGIKRLAVILAWTFGLIAFLVPTFKYMLGSQESLYEVLVSLFSAGVVGVFLIDSNYATLIGAISGGFQDLSTAITGTDDTGSVIEKMINVFSKVFKGISDNMPGSWDMIKNVGHTILILIMGFMCLIFMLISLFFMIVYTNIGNALMAVGIALGPIFVGCAVSSTTRIFFGKWLHYMLIAGTYKIIGAVLLTLISVAPIVPASIEGRDMITAMQNILSITMLMAIMAYLSTMIPDIANAILPGQIGGMGGQVGKADRGVQRMKKMLNGRNTKPSSEKSSGK